MVVPTIVGIPVGVNPAVSHSISQVVAVPFSVHPKSAVVDVKLVTVNADGSGQATEIATESNKIPISKGAGAVVGSVFLIDKINSALVLFKGIVTV